MIILGSQSPRRKAILSYFSLPFKQVVSDFDEFSIPWQGDPEAYVSSIALGKAKTLLPRFPNTPILTADTIVYYAGKIYLKPKDEQEAYTIFSQLMGNWHSVYTGVSLMINETEFLAVEQTKVLFNSLTDAQIRKYLHHLPYADKAAGYFIHEAGSLIVERIEGCFYNVMGLPINTVHQLLLNINIDLWNYLLPPKDERTP
jgi:septum formation protein